VLPFSLILYLNFYLFISWICFDLFIPPSPFFCLFLVLGLFFYSLFCFISSFLLTSVSFLSPNFCSLKVLCCCRIYKRYFISVNVLTIVSEFYTRIFMVYKLSENNLFFLFRIIWANRILTNDTPTHKHTHTHTRALESAALALQLVLSVL